MYLLWLSIQTTVALASAVLLCFADAIMMFLHHFSLSGFILNM